MPSPAPDPYLTKNSVIDYFKNKQKRTEKNKNNSFSLSPLSFTPGYPSCLTDITKKHW